MFSKLIKTFAVSALVSARQKAPKRKVLAPIVGGKDTATDNEDGERSCTYASYILNKGPDIWEDVIGTGTPYTDTNFEGLEMIYWDDIVDEATKEYFTDWYDIEDDTSFIRWPEQTSTTDGVYWDSDTGPHFDDIEQGGLGSCYLLASISGAAEYPELIQNCFLTDTPNDEGIIAVQMYVRGKPYAFTIDDYLPYYDALGDGELALAFAQIPDDNFMWGPILEKAWAKVAGNYGHADLGGYNQAGLMAVAGAPVFEFWSGWDYTTDDEATTMWELANAADENGYLMGVTVFGESDYNSCGIVTGHAYSLLSTFEMEDADGDVHTMYLIRNPWGSTTYDQDWNFEDERWTDELVAQVPLSIDPRTSQDQGIFAMPVEKSVECTNAIQIAHLRDDYKSIWYDQEDNFDGDWQTYYYYYVTIPDSSNLDSDLYFSVETYYQTYLPTDCLIDQWSAASTWVALVNLKDLENQDDDEAMDMNNGDYVYYSQDYSYPIMVAAGDYAAGDTIMIEVNFEWEDVVPILDFTVRLYSALEDGNTIWIKDVNDYAYMIHMDGTEPSGFTESTYRNGVEIALPQDRSLVEEAREEQYEAYLEYIAEIEDRTVNPTCFWDAWDLTPTWADFFIALLSNPWILLVWWCADLSDYYEVYPQAIYYEYAF